MGNFASERLLSDDGLPAQQVSASPAPLPKELGRWAATLLACLWTLSWVSLIRFALAGTLNLDVGPWAPASCPGLQLLIAALLGVAGWAYLAALKAASAKAEARDWVPLSPAMLRWAVGLQLAVMFALPLTSNDAFPNLAYGRLLSLGMNPHVFRPCDLPFGQDLVPLIGYWFEQPSVYGPAITALEALPGALPAAPGLVVFKLLIGSLGLAMTLLVWRWCHLCVPPQRQARSFIFFAWNPLFIWEIAGQAHNDALLMLGLLGFGWALTRDRSWTAVSLLGLALLSKLSALPAGGLFLFGEMRRSPWKALGLLIWLLLLLALAYAPLWQGGVALCPALESSRESLDHVANSLADLVARAALFGFGGSAQAVCFQAYTVLTKVLLGMLALGLADRVRSWLDVLRGGAVFLLVQQGIGLGWYQPWYPLWILPLALVARDRAVEQALALYTVLICWLYLPDNPLTLVGRLGVHLMPIWLLGQAGLIPCGPLSKAPGLSELERRAPSFWPSWHRW